MGDHATVPAKKTGTSVLVNCRGKKAGCQMDGFEFAMYESSIGYVVLVARNGKLIRLNISDAGLYEVKKEVLGLYPGARESLTAFKTVRTLLDRYLRGMPVDFDVEVDISDCADFTQQVLTKLRTIPYGEVRSYGWIAKELGCPGAGRAVGQAVKRNPLPIIIPCHRVIREDGSIGGFSLGVRLKKKLLALEGVKVRKP